MADDSGMNEFNTAQAPPVERMVRPASPLVGAGALVRSWWVQNVLPWVTSGVLHLAIIVTVILLYTAREVLRPKVVEQPYIPDAVMADGPVGGVPNPGLGSDPNRIAAQDQITDSDQRQVETQGRRLNEAVAGASEGANESILGVGPNSSFTKGRGMGTGEGGGGGDRAGGIFGVPGGGGGGGPKVNFVGSSSNAVRVVYVCDASGSMIKVFTGLQRQLRMSIDQLRIPQQFGVITFNEVTNSLGNQLLLATPENKRKANEFIQKQIAQNGTKPASAIAQAFALEPQLIFVLTDGFDQGDPAAILEQFRKLNRDKKVKINTILLRSIEDPELVRLLKTIASENGGTYREVEQQDF